MRIGHLQKHTSTYKQQAVRHSLILRCQGLATTPHEVVPAWLVWITARNTTLLLSTSLGAC